METKICTRCKEDFPINEFLRKITNYRSKKTGLMIRYDNIGGRCKACRRITQIEWRAAEKLKKPEGERIIDKYQSTENYKRRRKEYYQSDHGKNLMKIKTKRRVDNLQDSYIKELLGKKFEIHDPSPEIIQAKRLQIMLYREIKAIKDEQKENLSN